MHYPEVPHHKSRLLGLPVTVDLLKNSTGDRYVALVNVSFAAALTDRWRHHRAVGDVAIAGIYHRAAVLHGGDDRQNRPAGESSSAVLPRRLSGWYSAALCSAWRSVKPDWRTGPPGRCRKLTDSWVLMVASVVLLSYALAFVMPSNMGRIALLMPIVAAMAKRAGIADGSRAWFGLALAVGFGTFQLSATILPANVPNLVMSGAAEGSYGIHLKLCPVSAAAHAGARYPQRLILIGLICWLFPGSPKPPKEQAPSDPMGGMKSVLPGCWRWCWGCGSRRAGTA